MSDEIFNTPFETALRIVLLLETEMRPDFTVNMIAAMDFAALYGKSFGISSYNLHGDNIFKFSEFATRKELANDGIRYLVQKGLVNASATEQGFTYSISEIGKVFAKKLATKYAQDYREQVGLSVKHFRQDPEQIILGKINKIAVESLEKEVSALHEE